MKEIIVCLKNREDDVLTKQLSMLSERNHAGVRRISFGEVESCIDTGDGDVMFISDDEVLLEKARSKGMAVNSPQKMKESYQKAMEMLGGMIGRREGFP